MQEIPVVLIGHKDHGKSTLISRLLLDTKSIKQSKLKRIKEIDNLPGQKFELAYLLDSFKEERERKMTIDTTRVLLKGKKKNYKLIDVPGHEELISNMLTGTAGAEVALLVVDIKEGIKEQTRQHLEIAKLLGIEQLGVVINKMDKVDYQKEKFEEIKRKLRNILNKTKYSIKDTCFIPVSAQEGDNITQKSPRILWYTGLTLMDFLEKKIKSPESFDNLPLRFLTQDKYLNKEQEIIVGKIESGRIELGQEILFLPGNKKARIRSILDSGTKLKTAKAGQNIGITLKENLDISRGEVGVSPNSLPKVSNILSGEIFWIKAPSQNKLVCECGTAQVSGIFKKHHFIEEKKKTQFLIKLEIPLVFEPQSKTILGKLILKEKGKIIGVGKINSY